MTSSRRNRGSAFAGSWILSVAILPLLYSTVRAQIDATADYFIYNTDAELANIGASIDVNEAITSYGLQRAGLATTSYNDLTATGTEIDWRTADFLGGRFAGVLSSAVRKRVAFASAGGATVQTLYGAGPGGFPDATFRESVQFSGAALRPPSGIQYNDSSPRVAPGTRWDPGSSTRPFYVHSIALCGQYALAVGGAFTDAAGGAFVTVLENVNSTRCPLNSTDEVACTPDAAPLDVNPDQILSTTTRYSWLRVQSMGSSSSSFGRGLSCTKSGPVKLAIGVPDQNVVLVYARRDEALAALGLSDAVAGVAVNTVDRSVLPLGPHVAKSTLVDRGTAVEVYPPQFLAVAIVNITNESESPAIGVGYGPVASGGWGFGFDLRILQNHLIVGAPGAGTFLFDALARRDLIGGGRTQGGAAYVYDLEGAASMALGIGAKLLNHGGGDSPRYLRSPSVTSARLAQSSTGVVAASNAWQYKLVCRFAGQTLAGKLGYSMAVDTSPNGDQLQIWSGAPASNRVLAFSVLTQSRSCSQDAYITGFRITSELDIGQSAGMWGEIGYIGSPSASNVALVSTAQRGRMYVKAWCYPNRMIVWPTASSSSHVRLCGACPPGKFTKGGDAIYSYQSVLPPCETCGNVKPSRAEWIAEAGCVWKCHAGFFGSACMTCSSYMTGTAAFLPPNAVWIDDEDTYTSLLAVSTPVDPVCVWRCDSGFDLNATAAVVKSIRVKDNDVLYASQVMNGTLLSTVCIPPPPPDRVRAIAVLSFALNSTSIGVSSSITHSTVRVAVLVPPPTNPYAPVHTLTFKLDYNASIITSLGIAAGSTGLLIQRISLSDSTAVSAGNPVDTAYVRAALEDEGLPSENVTRLLSNLIVVRVMLSGLLGGTSYRVTVAAVNIGGQGIFSPAAPRLSQSPDMAAVTLPPVSPMSPTLPSLAFFPSPSSVTVTWSAPEDMGGSPPLAIEVCLVRVEVGAVVQLLVAELGVEANSGNENCTLIAVRGFVGILQQRKGREGVDTGAGAGVTFAPADVQLAFNIAVDSLTNGAGTVAAGTNLTAARMQLESSLPLASSVSSRQWDTVDARSTNITIFGLRGQSTYLARVRMYTAAGVSPHSLFSDVVTLPPPELPTTLLPSFFVSFRSTTGGNFTPVLQQGIACTGATGSTLSLGWGGVMNNGGASVSYEVEAAYAGPSTGDGVVPTSSINYTWFVQRIVARAIVSAGVQVDGWTVDAMPAARIVGLQARSMYYVRVTPFNYVGMGLGSDLDPAVGFGVCSTGEPMAPSSPAMVGIPISTPALWQPSAVGGSIKDVGPAHVALTWVSPVDDGGLPALNYTLAVAFVVPLQPTGTASGLGVGQMPLLPFPFYGTNASRSYAIAEIGVGSLNSVQLIGLPTGATLCFAVRASNAVGYSGWSADVADPTLPIEAWQAMNATYAGTFLPRVCITTPAATIPVAPFTPQLVRAGLVRIVTPGIESLTGTDQATGQKRLIQSLIPANTNVEAYRTLISRVVSRFGTDLTRLVDILNRKDLLSCCAIIEAPDRAALGTLDNRTLMNSMTIRRKEAAGWLLLSITLPASTLGLPVTDVIVEASVDSVSFTPAQVLVLYLPGGYDGSDMLSQRVLGAFPLYNVTSINVNGSLTSTETVHIEGVMDSLIAVRDARANEADLLQGSAIASHALVMVTGLAAATPYYLRTAVATAAGVTSMSVRSSVVVTGMVDVPSRPGILSLQRLPGTHVQLTWLPPVDNGGVLAGSLVYKVYVAVQVPALDCGGPNGSAPFLPAVQADGSANVADAAHWLYAVTTQPGSRSATITSLRAGGTYAFAVTAVTGAGEGPASLPLLNVSTGLAQPPQPPSQTSLQALALSSSMAQVQFSQSQDDGGTAVLGYRVYFRRLSAVRNESSVIGPWTLAKDEIASSSIAAYGRNCSLKMTYAGLTFTANRLDVSVGFLRAEARYAIAVQAYNRAGAGPLSSAAGCNTSTSTWAAGCPAVTMYGGIAPQRAGKPRLADLSTLSALATVSSTGTLWADALPTGARESGRGSNSLDVVWPLPSDFGGLEMTEARIMVQQELSDLPPLMTTVPFSAFHCLTLSNPSVLALVAVDSDVTPRAPVSQLGPATALCLGYVRLTGLKPSTSYSLTVFLLNSAGMANPSLSSDWLSTDDGGVPGTVTDLRLMSDAEAASLVLAGASGTGPGVFLTWPALVDTGRAPVSGYVFTWNATGACACAHSLDVGGGTYCSGSADLPVASVGISMLSDGRLAAALGDLCPVTEYSIVVSALSAAGQGQATAPVSVVSGNATAPGPIPVSTILLSASGTGKFSALHVRWGQPLGQGSLPITTYTLYLEWTREGSAGVTPGLIVPISVRAGNDTACGNSSWGAPISGLCSTITLPTLRAIAFSWCEQNNACATLPVGTYRVSIRATNDAGTSDVVRHTGARAAVLLPPPSVLRSAFAFPAYRSAVLGVLGMGTSATVVAVFNSTTAIAPLGVPVSAPGTVDMSVISSRLSTLSVIVFNNTAVVAGDLGTPVTVAQGGSLGGIIVAWRWLEVTEAQVSPLSSFLLELACSSYPLAPLRMVTVSLLNEIYAESVVATGIYGLEAGLTYSIRVAGCNTAGCGQYSSAAMISTSAALLLPPLAMAIFYSSNSTGTFYLSMRSQPAGALSPQVAIVTGLYVANASIREYAEAAATATSVGWQPKLIGSTPLLGVNSSSLLDEAVVNGTVYSLVGTQMRLTLEMGKSMGLMYGNFIFSDSAWPPSEETLAGLALQPSAMGIPFVATGLLAGSRALLIALRVGVDDAGPSSALALSVPSAWTPPGAPLPPTVTSLSAIHARLQWFAPTEGGGRPLVAFIVQVVPLKDAAASRPYGATQLDSSGQALLGLQLPSLVSSSLPVHTGQVTGMHADTVYVARVRALHDAGGALPLGSTLANTTVLSILANSSAFLAYELSYGVQMRLAYPADVATSAWSDWSTPFRTNKPVPPEAPSALHIESTLSFEASCNSSGGNIAVGPTCPAVTSGSVRMSWPALTEVGMGGAPLLTYRLYIAKNAPALLAAPRPAVPATSGALPVATFAAAEAAGLLADRPPHIVLPTAIFSAGGSAQWYVDVGCASAVTLAGLAASTEYSIRVSALNRAGEGPLSGSVVTLRTAPPSAPQTVTGTHVMDGDAVRSLMRASPGSSAGLLLAVPYNTGGSPLSHIMLDVVRESDFSARASAVVGAADCLLSGTVVGAMLAATNASVPGVYSLPDSIDGVYGPVVRWYPSRVCAVLLRGLSANTSYMARVSLVNAAGLFSATKWAAFVSGPAEAPAAPYSVLADSRGITSSTVDVSWSVPLEDGGSPILHYSVHLSVNAMVSWQDNRTVVAGPGSSVQTGALDGDGMYIVASPASNAEASLAASGMGVGSRGVLPVAGGAFSNATTIGTMTGLSAIAGLSTQASLQRSWYAGAVTLRARPSHSAQVLLTGDGDLCATAAAMVQAGTHGSLSLLYAVRVFPSDAARLAASASCAAQIVKLTQLAASQQYYIRVSAVSAVGSSTLAPAAFVPSLISTTSTINLFHTGVLSCSPVQALPRLSAEGAQVLLTYFKKSTPTVWARYSLPSSVLVTLAASAPTPVQSLRVIDAGSSWLTLSWLPPLDAGGLVPICYRLDVAVDGVMKGDMCDIAMGWTGYEAAAGYATSLLPPPPGNATGAALFSTAVVPAVWAWTSKVLVAPSNVTATKGTAMNSNVDVAVTPAQLSPAQLEALTGITPALTTWLPEHDVYGPLKLPFGAVWNSSARFRADSYATFAPLTCFAAPTPVPVLRAQAVADPGAAPAGLPYPLNPISGLPRELSATISTLPRNAVLRIRIAPVTAKFVLDIAGEASASANLGSAYAAGPQWGTRRAQGEEGEVKEAAPHSIEGKPVPSPAGAVSSPSPLSSPSTTVFTIASGHSNGMHVAVLVTPELEDVLREKHAQGRGMALTTPTVTATATVSRSSSATATATRTRSASATATSTPTATATASPSMSPSVPAPYVTFVPVAGTYRSPYSSWAEYWVGTPNLLAVLPADVPAAPAMPAVKTRNSSHTTVCFGPAPMTGGCSPHSITVLRATYPDWAETVVFFRDDRTAFPLLSRTNPNITKQLLSSLAEAAATAPASPAPTPLCVVDGPLYRATTVRYTVTLANYAGSSAPSAALVTSTTPTVAGPPANFSVSTFPGDITPVSVKVKWAYPPDDGGRTVTYFSVELAKLNFLNETTKLENQRVGQVGSPWMAAGNTLGSFATFTLINLAPSTFYATRVAGINAMGVGKFTELLTFRTRESLPCVGIADPSGPGSRDRGRCSGNGACHAWDGTCMCDTGYAAPGCQFLDGYLYAAKLTAYVITELTPNALKNMLGTTIGSLSKGSVMDVSRVVIIGNLTASANVRVLQGDGPRVDKAVVVRGMQTVSPVNSIQFRFLIAYTAAERASRESTIKSAPSTTVWSSAPRMPILSADPELSTSKVSEAMDAAARMGKSPLQSIGLTSLSLLADDASIISSTPTRISIQQAVCPYIQSDCDVCIENPACGWCASTATCNHGTAAGSSPWMKRPGESSTCAVDQQTGSVSADWYHAQGSRPTCKADCSTFTSCSDCSHRADCGWCEGTQECVRQVDVNKGLECSGLLSSTLLKLDTQCPQDRCKRYRTQNQCLYDRYCGYCEQPNAYNSYCSAGDAFGVIDPTLAQCSGRYLFRSSSVECGFDSTEIASCDVCLAKSGCGFCETNGQCGVAAVARTYPALGSCEKSSWYYTSASTSGPARICPTKALTNKERCMASSTSCIACLKNAETIGCAHCDRPSVTGMPKCMLLGDALAVPDPSVGKAVADKQCTDSALHGLGVMHPYTPLRPGINGSEAVLGTPLLVSLPREAAIGCSVSCVGLPTYLTAMSGSFMFGSAGAASGAVPQMYGMGEVGQCTWVVQPLEIPNVTIVSGTPIPPAIFPVVSLTLTAWDFAPGDTLSVFDGGAVGLSSGSSKGIPMTQLGSLSASSQPGQTMSFYSTSGSGVLQLVLRISAGGGKGFSVSWAGSRPVEVVSWFTETVKVVIGAIAGICLVATMCHYLWRSFRLPVDPPMRAPDETLEAAQARSQCTGRGAPRFVIASFPVFLFELALVDQTPMLFDKLGEGVRTENGCGGGEGIEKGKGKDEDADAVVVMPSPPAPIVVMTILSSPEHVEGEDTVTDNKKDVAVHSAMRPMCAICLSQVEDGEEVRVLLCRHGYHKDCIDPSLLLNKNCPMCRRDVSEMYAERASLISSRMPDPLTFGAKVTLVIAPQIEFEHGFNDADDFLARGRLRAQAMAAATGNFTGTGRVQDDALFTGANPMHGRLSGVGGGRGLNRGASFGGQAFVGGQDLSGNGATGSRGAAARLSAPRGAVAQDGSFRFDNPLNTGARRSAAGAAGRFSSTPMRTGSGVGMTVRSPPSSSSAGAARRRTVAAQLGLQVEGVADSDLRAILRALTEDGGENSSADASAPNMSIAQEESSQGQGGGLDEDEVEELASRRWLQDEDDNESAGASGGSVGTGSDSGAEAELEGGGAPVRRNLSTLPLPLPRALPLPPPPPPLSRGLGLAVPSHLIASDGEEGTMLLSPLVRSSSMQGVRGGTTGPPPPPHSQTRAQARPPPYPSNATSSTAGSSAGAGAAGVRTNTMHFRGFSSGDRQAGGPLGSTPGPAAQASTSGPESGMVQVEVNPLVVRNMMARERAAGRDYQDA